MSDLLIARLDRVGLTTRYGCYEASLVVGFKLCNDEYLQVGVGAVVVPNNYASDVRLTRFINIGSLVGIGVADPPATQRF